MSPWIGLLARIDSRTPEVLANFDIRIARDLAWMTAEQLAARPSSDWPSPIGELDTRTTLFGNLVRYPGPILRAGFLAIRLRETASPRKVIDVLCSVA